jgi:hypothetical protein
LSPHTALSVWSGVGHFSIGYQNLSVASPYKMSHSRLRKEVWNYLDSLGALGFKLVAANGGLIVVSPYWFPTLLFAVLTATPWVRWIRRFTLRTLLYAIALAAVALGAIIALSR